MLRNVSAPTVTAFLPDPAKATGAGVIVAPGGGFFALSIDEEGNDVARWLAARGVAGFVLKYRVQPSPPDSKAFWELFGKPRSYDQTAPGEAEATEDARAALQKIRASASSFGVDPARIGVLGFSAGGFVAVDLAVDSTSRPAFVGVIYAAVRRSVSVPADAPPMFAAIAADDPLFGGEATSGYASWHAAKRPVELHVYEKGGHGFGMRVQHLPSDGWIDAFHAWLVSQGITGPRTP
jgi:acetyl esterase/lipase